MFTNYQLVSSLLIQVMVLTYTLVRWHMSK
jgi:hypothetical protein